MLNVCICDDDPRDAAQVRALAEDFAQKHPEFPMKIEDFSSADDLLKRLGGKGEFDLYLLDVIMPCMGGIELARAIRARQETAEILFLTSSREYALDAFDVAAGGYLLKPVEEEKFHKVFLTAVQRLRKPENLSLLLKVKDCLRRIPFRELVAVESFNHDRVCTLADGSRAVTNDTLASLMERLSVDSRFFSPHRAYIINLEHITALNADSVLLSNGQRVPVSRANLPALKRAYLDYLF